MPRNVRLDDIVSGIPEVDAAFRAMREAIEGAHNWEITGPVVFLGTKDGYALTITSPRMERAVVTTAIAAAPDADSVGSGEAMLRIRDGTDLADGDLVTVTSDFSVAIPVGTRIVVAPDGGRYMLVAADCPGG